MSITSANVFSKRPDALVYEEPLFLVVNNGKDSALSEMIRAAYALKQMRFSFEDIPGGVVHNVQIMENAHPSQGVNLVAGKLTGQIPSLTNTQLREILLGSSLPSEKLEQLYHEGKLVDFPELINLRGIPQEPEWHPEGDVWIHTLMVVDEAWKIAQRSSHFSDEDKYALMLGALCHDLGKPLTTKRQEIRSTHHMMPPHLYRELFSAEEPNISYQKAVMKLIRKLPENSLPIFLAACEADNRGRGTEAAKQPEFFWKTEFEMIVHQAVLHSAPTKEPPLISGTELMSALSLPQGPQVGRLLRKINQAWHEGRIADSTEAIVFARGLLED